jgi:hypothetical protein
MPAPVGIEADPGLDLRAPVGLGVELRVQHVVGQIGAEVQFREQQEAAEPDAERRKRIEVVRLGQERGIDLAERGLSRRRRTEPERFHRYAGFLRLEASLVLLRLEGSLARLIAEAAESPRRRLSGSSPIPPSGSGMVVLSHPPNESAVPPAA